MYIPDYCVRCSVWYTCKTFLSNYLVYLVPSSLNFNDHPLIQLFLSHCWVIQTMNYRQHKTTQFFVNLNRIWHYHVITCNKLQDAGNKSRQRLHLRFCLCVNFDKHHVNYTLFCGQLSLAHRRKGGIPFSCRMSRALTKISAICKADWCKLGLAVCRAVLPLISGLKDK